jgi:hypothetical protein
MWVILEIGIPVAGLVVFFLLISGRLTITRVAWPMGLKKPCWLLDKAKPAARRPREPR